MTHSSWVPMLRCCGSNSSQTVTDSDPPTFVGHHLCGDIHQRTLLLRDQFSSTFPSMNEHQMMGLAAGVS